MDSKPGDRPTILILGEIEHAHDELDALSKACNIIYPKSTSRADFIQELQTSPIFKSSSLLAAYRTFDSIKISGRIDAELLTYFPPSLRFISHVGAGYDQVDVAACSEVGIHVSNTPGAVDDATSDIAIFLILGALRNVNFGMETLRRGAWRGEKGNLMPLGNDPHGKLMGILGMGGIGQATRDKAAAFGMKTQYYNRTKLSPELEHGAKYVTFEELLKTSDVVFVSLPLNANTRHIISTKEFDLMKKGSVLVNIARGAIVDEAALVNALDTGKIRSCGLDVFEAEPEIHEGLLRNPNVILVPHMGTWTIENRISCLLVSVKAPIRAQLLSALESHTQRKMESLALANVVSVIESGVLKTPVPEQQKEPPKPRK